MIDLKKEKEFLDSLVIDYKDQTPYSAAKKDVINSIIDNVTTNTKSKKALQLGCSGGYETDYLSSKFKQLDVIDGSSTFIERMKKDNKKKNIRFVYSLFEEYEIVEDEYDYIFCNYILEHVLEPRVVLKRFYTALKQGGLFIATVPNSNAFSRKLAKEMGLINDLKALTENDLRHGHRRVYDHKNIVKDFEKSGYGIVKTIGIVFKILADFQLNELMKQGIITTAHIFGLQRMAESNDENKNLSDSLLIIARK